MDLCGAANLLCASRRSAASDSGPSAGNCAIKTFQKRIAPEQIQFPEVNSADELSRNKINSQGFNFSCGSFSDVHKKSHLRLSDSTGRSNIFTFGRFAFLILRVSATRECATAAPPWELKLPDNEE